MPDTEELTDALQALNPANIMSDNADIVITGNPAVGAGLPGGVRIIGGVGSTSEGGGLAELYGGDSVDIQRGGQASLHGGNAGGTGFGGDVLVNAGLSSGGNGGSTYVTGGNAFDTGNGGNLHLDAGLSLNGGNDGLIILGQQNAALPTADPHVAGALWNDAGTLKISAG